MSASSAPTSPVPDGCVRDSRVNGTTLLAETLAKLANPPGVLLAGSAIGICGDRGDEI